MKRILFLSVVVFLASFAAKAQTNYQQQYLNAKQLYSSGRYALAREAFRPLIARDPGNPFAPYASFFFGVSTFKAGYEEQAKDILLQTRERFPNWSKADEVKYWLAVCYFESNDDFLAMNTLNSIKDPQIRKDGEGLMYHYLMPDTSSDEMAALYEKYKNPVTGRIYAAKLSGEPLDAEGRKILEGLVEEYSLDPDRYLAGVQSSELKPKYKVAVMLPFLAETLKPRDRQRVNEFVLDLYKGIRLGFDSLRNSGIDIDLYAYDTQRDTLVTRSIVSRDELKGMDLIIGPLFPDHTAIVNEFSHQYAINMFNPLTSSPEFIAENPYHFLFNPSVLTIGEVMAEDNYERFGDKPGMVIYGETANDQLMAQAYADRYNALGGTLSVVRGIGRDNSEEILELLLSSESIKDASTEEGRENMAIAPDSIGHIFVASNNSLIYSKVIGAVDTRGDGIRVIGNAGWLESPVVSYDVYERLDVIFYAPGYVDRNNPSYEVFRNKYLRRHYEVPSEYAEKGYEMALFLGRSLKDYGNYPQVGWIEHVKERGSLTSGFKYGEAQDNQLVPVLTFGEDGLEETIKERRSKDED